MRLRSTGATVAFRADLPAWLEPKGAAFIEITARPMGRCNTAFMAARESAVLSHRMRTGDAPESEVETVEQFQHKREFGREWMCAIYDTCVISWRTNLVDDETGAALACDRDTFIELADLRIAEIGKVFLDFQTALMEAGAKVIADTEATIKN